MRQPLEGIKVLDITTGGVGPIISWELAMWGGDVIRIESVRRPCITRVSMPFKDNQPGLNRSYVFPLANWKKRSFGVKLDHPKGLELVRKLVGWTDIIVMSFSRRAIEKWGLNYEEVSKINPEIIMLQTSMQGATGPRADSIGWGMMLKALVGFVHLTGWPDRLGVGPLPPYTDYIAPFWGVAAILAALDNRRRTGKGLFIDLSQYEASLHFIGPLIMDYFANKRVNTRCGNESPHAAPHGAFRCKGEDKWCTIAVCTDQEWTAFCNALGESEWTREPRFATLCSRKENEQELNRLVNEWTENYTPHEVMETLQSVGVAASVVEDGIDLWEHDSQLKGRDFFRTIDHPEMGPFSYFRLPPVFSKVPLETGPAPCLGQDNEYVCTQILGLSDEELADLMSNGILESA